MTVYKIYPVGFAANSYLITADGINAIAIDPAQPRIEREAARRRLAVKYVLLTHGHFDHIAGCGALQEKGAKIGCLFRERTLLFGENNLAASMGGIEIPPFSLDFTVEDGQELSLCSLSVRVAATPGHTAGSACYLIGNALFSGDTLFQGSVGRCDLPTGNASALSSSLQKLFSLESDYTVYPGHGEDTTLAYERKFNPYG